jgi:ankyrin repeat protein
MIIQGPIMLNRLKPPYVVVAAGTDENLSVILVLADHGCNINVEESDGKPPTPLPTALVSKQPLKATKLLVGRSADVNIEDNKGVTPLLMAAEEG